MVKQMWLCAAILAGIATNAAADPMVAPPAQLKAEMDQAMKQAQAEQLSRHRELVASEFGETVGQAPRRILKAERKRAAIAAAKSGLMVEAGTVWNVLPTMQLADGEPPTPKAVAVK